MADGGYKRKLIAILSADVAGYSRLMGDDEAATVSTLKSHRNLISENVLAHQGRVIDSPGDNILAEFGSIVDAVSCAVTIQEGLHEQNDKLPENRKMQFRIGVNLGDVIQDGNRIYGDGVNISARVEGLADPGGVAISGTAFDNIRNKLDYGYQFSGEHAVKNIANPIRVYKVLTAPEFSGKIIGEKQFLGRMSRKVAVAAILASIVMIGGLISYYIYLHQSGRIEPASVDKMAFPLPDKPSIAVLPFDNLTGDPHQEYFSDGITEELITALSKIPKLFVIARNSTFSYKGKPVKVQKVSEDLGVQYVVEGSVRRAEDRVRITAQLIDALNGRHIWAEKYDRDFKDIFAIQDEITKKIITALQIKLTEGTQAGIYAKGTDTLEAYLKVMEGNWLYSQLSKEGVLKARQLAEEAITLDPNYAFAYQLLGRTHGVTLQLGMSKNPRESLNRAIGLIRKAIELDDSLAIGHVSLGGYLLYAREYDKAIAEGKRGLELEPNSADVLYGYAAITALAGNPEDAIPYFKEALRINPKPPSLYFHLYGIALRDSGNLQEAIVQARKAIEQEPNNLIAWVVLTSSLGLDGRNEEAREAANEILRLKPNFSVDRYEKVSPQKDRTAVKRFCDALREAGLPE